jgi:hypothetical protein
VGPRAALDDVEKTLDPTGTRNPTPHSSSPYQVAVPTALALLPKSRYVLKDYFHFLYVVCAGMKRTHSAKIMSVLVSACFHPRN